MSDIDRDAYATRRRETTEGRVYTVTGGDWDAIFGGRPDRARNASSSTWARSTRPPTACCGSCSSSRARRSPTPRVVIGYLHTGIEKNTEYRNWTQGVTFLTRADYLSPIFNETVYCLGVEKLLGIEVPERAQADPVLLMEINRISSHWVWLATGGMELGALTAMTNGFRARERCLDVLELITGLRMNHAYVRPGGVAQDLPDGAVEKIRDWVKEHAARSSTASRSCCAASRSGCSRLKDVGWIGVEGCLSLGVTGPLLRAAGLPWDLRKTEPVPRLRDASTSRCRPTTRGDCWARFVVRVAEMHESLKIVEQVLRPPGARPGHGRRPEDRLAGEAVARPGRHGQLARARPEDHEQLDGVADPPLQAGHRGLPGAARAGVPGRRVPARRARRPRRQRRRHPAVPGPLPGAVVHQPAGGRRRCRSAASSPTSSPPSPPSTR